MFSHHPTSSEPGHLPCTPAAGEYEIVQEIGEAIFLARPCESPPPPAHLNTTLSCGAQKTHAHQLFVDATARILLEAEAAPQ